MLPGWLIQSVRPRIPEGELSRRGLRVTRMSGDSVLFRVVAAETDGDAAAEGWRVAFALGLLDGERDKQGRTVPLGALDDDRSSNRLDAVLEPDQA